MNSFHAKLPYQKPMLRQIEWWIQNGPTTKNSFASYYFIYLFTLKILFQFKNSYKKLISCTNNPNAYIWILFVSNEVLFDNAFSLQVSLKSSAQNIGNESIFKINTTERSRTFNQYFDVFLFGKIYHWNTWILIKVWEI